MVKSPVPFAVVCTGKKKRKAWKLLSLLGEFDTDLLIGQNNHEAQFESRVNTMEEYITSTNVNDLAQADSPQVDLHTLERSIAGTVRSEVENVMSSVQTRVQDAILTATESLVIPRVEVAMRSVNASSGDANSVVPDPEQKDVLGIIENPQMTDSNRMK